MRVLITVALGRVPDYAAPDIRGTSAGRQQWDVGRSHVFRTSEGRLVLSGCMFRFSLGPTAVG